MQLEKAHSEWLSAVAAWAKRGGVQVEWPLVVFSKALTHEGRSSINYYFRLFKLREDKKVGGSLKSETDRETQRELSLLHCS